MNIILSAAPIYVVASLALREAAYEVARAKTNPTQPWLHIYTRLSEEEAITQLPRFKANPVRFKPNTTPKEQKRIFRGEEDVRSIYAAHWRWAGAAVAFTLPRARIYARTKKTDDFTHAAALARYGG